MKRKAIINSIKGTKLSKMEKILLSKEAVKYAYDIFKTEKELTKDHD